jgi:peptidyl-prolyl cis-trans isomerase C
MSSIRNLTELEDSEIEELLPEAHSTIAISPRLNHRPGPIRRISRQPLVHFLLAGVVLFAASSFLERNNGRRSSAIQVSAAEIQRLEDVWSRQYGRTPTPSELRNLIDDYVREEVYYREAVASGLDKDDSIIRRRLVEKMEFLSQEVASGEPNDKELQEYFDRNREKFQLPAQVAFSHVFFSPTKRGATLQSDAANALVLIENKKTSGDASKLGDPFMLQSEYPLQTAEEVRALFGSEFTDQLFKLRTGEWQGPIRSSYGLHLVRIVRYQRSHAPQLDEVRSQVVTDFKNARLQDASEAYYARLRQHYQIEIDNAALAAAQSSGGASAKVSQPEEKAPPDVD